MRTDRREHRRRRRLGRRCRARSAAGRSRPIRGGVGTGRTAIPGNRTRGGGGTPVGGCQTAGRDEVGCRGSRTAVGPADPTSGNARTTRPVRHPRRRAGGAGGQPVRLARRRVRLARLPGRPGFVAGFRPGYASAGAVWARVLTQSAVRWTASMADTFGTCPSTRRAFSTEKASRWPSSPGR